MSAAASATAPVFLDLRVPPIGAYWAGQGGVYAGIVRGVDGEPDYHLIVGPECKNKLVWDRAVDYAAGADADGHRDFALPNRRDGHVAQANVPELFKREWYWLSEQHASDSIIAWGQDFSNGFQSRWVKDFRVRVRVVRRLIIQ